MEALKRLTLLTVGLFLILVGCSDAASSEGKPNEIRLDYAHYSPPSLVVKEFNLMENEFEEEGIEIEWVFSQGSNNALEYLNSNSADFGSSAGAAAVMSKANGAPIKNIYVYASPEVSALFAHPESGIKDVGDLKNKQIAATLGTDPYIFLIRALDEQGVSPQDVDIVNLQHGEGASALISGSVDAWAGLDPHMARLELESDTEVFYRNPEFTTHGFINVREDFAEKYPEYVKRVIKVYEEARHWILENPEGTAEILAEEADINIEVAERQLERFNFDQPVPDQTYFDSVVKAGEVLQEYEVMDPSADVEKLTSEYMDPTFAEEVIYEE
jgi:sulfonate transport system substrate-binding protein